MNKLTYVTDKKRHLICVPYSIGNLHIMARVLGLNRCWFHRNHYDIPIFRKDEFKKICTLVDPKNIVEIIQNPQYATIILSSHIGGGATPKDYFAQTQMQYNGFGNKGFS